jgi:LysR family tcuABC transcriptional regulator
VELRQLRYFVRVVEQGSMGRAAKALGVVTSALSQQLSRLESELSVRLLQRSAGGVRPTDAGMAFYKQAQLALRHADDAVRAAQQARLSGHVSVGLAPSTSAVLALPFIAAMRERYPDVRVRLVESLSGNLAAMLNARQLDVAMLFEAGTAQRWSLLPLLVERLFLIGRRDMPELAAVQEARRHIAEMTEIPLLLPSRPHGLRAVVDAAFAQVQCEPHVVLEIDGLAVLMDAVQAGLGATVQPGAATVRLADDAVARIEIADPHAQRINILASLGDDELSPAALAARLVLRDVATELVVNGGWPGATLHDA